MASWCQNWARLVLYLSIEAAAGLFWAFATPFGLLFQAMAPWEAPIIRFVGPVATAVAVAFSKVVSFLTRPHSSERVRRPKSGREHDKTEHEAEMQRRQREAEARADRVFAELEKGFLFEDSLDGASTLVEISTDGVGYVKVDCSLDFALPSRRVLDVFCVPLFRAGVELTGLIVQVAEGEGERKCYERIGVFETTEEEIDKLGLYEHEVFLLV